MKTRRANITTDENGGVARLGYSSREVAVSLGVSEKHVKNLLRDGQIPSVTLGKRRIVLESDLRAALEAKRQHGWKPEDSAAA